MVENRPIVTFFAHLMLILGVAIVAFPVYIALIASTHGPNDFMSGVLPLTPGSEGWHTYRQMLTSGVSTSGAPPIGIMMFNSLVMACLIPRRP